MGRLFREFALTVTASIFVSALVSLTLAPMLCSRFMRTCERAWPLSIAASKPHSTRCWQVSEDARYRTAPPSYYLLVFFITLGGTVVLMVQIPKGFVPIQDTGLIRASRRPPKMSHRRKCNASKGCLVRSFCAIPTLRVQFADCEYRRQWQCPDSKYRTLHHRSQTPRMNARSARPRS